jgi:hypothetical protein|tara:strand:- start:211 stop:390 length:180 start_codon:yes stop_codon:yes gene_type:complete
MAEKKEKQVERYELVQVPTKTEIAFRDNTTEKEEESVLEEKEVLRRIANDISELKRALI